MALFGIKRIQYCKATQLAFSGQNNPFLGIASEPTNTFTDIVCMINSRATLTIEQAVVNKQIVYTAKLQFVTPADPMLDVDHYAFIATTNEGERILLGANTRPQVAVVTAQGVFGTSGELTAYTTTAEFKANYRPLRLPVTAAEPISGPAYDICCGQIPQPQPADNREFTIKGGAIAPENEPADDREFTIRRGAIAPENEPSDDREFDICCGQIAQPVEPDTRKFDICCGEVVGIVPDPFPRPNPYPVALPTKQTSHAMEELLKNTVNQYIYHYYSLDGLSLFRYSLGLPHAEEAWQWYDQRSRRKIVFSEFTNRDAWSEYRKTLDDTYNSDTVTDVITDERVVGFQTQEWQSEYRDLLRFIADFMPTADQWLISEMAALNFPEIEFEYSIDGTSKIESGNNTADNNGINISLYVPKTISYFKIKEDDYTKYLFSQCQFSYIDSFGNSWEGKNIHPIYSAYKEGLQIGFYTDEWQGTI